MDEKGLKLSYQRVVNPRERSTKKKQNYLQNQKYCFEFTLVHLYLYNEGKRILLMINQLRK